MIREHNQVFRLYCHECQRVFHDRLINKTDKRYFYGILSEMSSKHFSKVRGFFVLIVLGRVYFRNLPKWVKMWFPGGDLYASTKFTCSKRVENHLLTSTEINPVGYCIS